MVFPKEIIVNEMFSDLSQDLDEKAKQIISDAGISGGERFKKEILPALAQRCSLNGLQNMIGLVLPKRAGTWFWKKIKESLFVPLAESIVDYLPQYLDQQIQLPTAGVFDSVGMDICSSHMYLFVSLQVTLNQLQTQITQAQSQAADYASQMQQLKDTCQTIKNDMLQMQFDLQNH